MCSLEQDAKPKVFISSSFKDFAHQGEVDLALRQRIVEDAATLPICCRAYETQNLEPAADADEIIDRCFSGIRGCDLFVFLLTGRHGSGVGYLASGILSSYLELELFSAAMLDKPILVLHLRDREPQPALRDVMALLRSAFDAAEYYIDDERGLRDHFRAVCLRFAEGRRVVQSSPMSAQLPDWLSIRRTRPTSQEDVDAPALQFLGGQFACSGKAADMDKARALIAQLDEGTRGAASARKAMSHGAALFRLWAAIRELIDDTGSARADPLLAPLWDQALGRWAAHASWLGLHGHLWLGPMAAVNSQSQLRHDFATNKFFKSANNVREPLGARASALYSIAQRLRSRERQVFHYKEVEQLATRAMALDPRNAQGARTIRAHAALRLAQSGRYWKVWDAERDFRAALRAREQSGASPAQIGESMVDLGFLFAFTLRSRRGFDLMEKGLELMRTGQGPNGMTFVMRGLRKLEQAALFHKKARRAEEARREIDNLAKITEAFDQARTVR